MFFLFFQSPIPSSCQQGIPLRPVPCASSMKSLNNPKTLSFSLRTPCFESIVKKAERRKKMSKEEDQIDTTLPSCQQGPIEPVPRARGRFMIPSFHFQAYNLPSKTTGPTLVSQYRVLFLPNIVSVCALSRNGLRGRGRNALTPVLSQRGVTSEGP